MFSDYINKEFIKMKNEIFNDGPIGEGKANMKKFLHERFNFNFDELEVTKVKTDGGYEAEISMPGFKKEHVKVTKGGNHVYISAKNDRRERQVEFVYYPDKEEVKRLKLEDGILTVVFEYIKKSRPETVEIPLD